MPTRRINPLSDQRATLILAEARGDVNALQRARTSEDSTIRAVALGGLDRLEALTIADLTTALGDQAAEVRCRAIELAIGFGEIDLVPMLRDRDDLVVETCAWALGERGPAVSSVVRPLSDVASSHDVSICREAAVAALGAIGSPDGLPAILAAMQDRAPVRRRAVLALAPFDGEQVTDALHAALEDRDRQVRQAAEDLLGT